MLQAFGTSNLIYKIGNMQLAKNNQNVQFPFQHTNLNMHFATFNVQHEIVSMLNNNQLKIFCFHFNAQFSTFNIQSTI